MLPKYNTVAHHFLNITHQFLVCLFLPKSKIWGTSKNSFKTSRLIWFENQPDGLHMVVVVPRRLLKNKRTRKSVFCWCFSLYGCCLTHFMLTHFNPLKPLKANVFRDKLYPSWIFTSFVNDGIDCNYSSQFQFVTKFKGVEKGIIFKKKTVNISEIILIPKKLT